MKTKGKIHLTFKDVHDALQENKYIILVDDDMNKYGFNGGIGNLAPIKAVYQKVNKEAASIFIGYYACGLQEYITYKIGFKS